MANGFVSDLFADAILAKVLNGTALPTSYWVGLTLVLPTDGTDSAVVEPGATEYIRLEMPVNGTSWVSMGSGSRSMESLIELIYAQAITDWGEIVGYILYDAVTAGTYLGFGIVDPYTVLAGMRVRLPAGVIVVNIPAT